MVGFRHRRKREVGGGVGAGVRGGAGKRESETVKREVNQEGWSGRRRGYTTVPGTRGARGRDGGEERDERGGAAARRASPRRGRWGSGGKFWGSMDATPRGTTLSWILRSKPATA